MEELYTVTSVEPGEYDALARLWERSVRATHHFLSEEEILFYAPLVREQYLPGIGTLYCARTGFGQIAAFAGIEDDSLEMLFVDPPYRGKGLGKLLVRHAIDRWNVCRVDVNEENSAACAFYNHLGFDCTGRDELDAQGQPHPILHLTLRH